MEYDVIRADSDTGLVRIVNELIKDGWEPLGGIAVDYEYVYQAMKRVKNNPDLS
jgi:hypothetical protein